jgi:hypothetical protein
MYYTKGVIGDYAEPFTKKPYSGENQAFRQGVDIVVSGYSLSINL